MTDFNIFFQFHLRSEINCGSITLGLRKYANLIACNSDLNCTKQTVRCQSDDMTHAFVLSW